MNAQNQPRVNEFDEWIAAGQRLAQRLHDTGDTFYFVASLLWKGFKFSGASVPEVYGTSINESHFRLNSGDWACHAYVYDRKRRRSGPSIPTVGSDEHKRQEEIAAKTKLLFAETMLWCQNCPRGSDRLATFLGDEKVAGWMYRVHSTGWQKPVGMSLIARRYFPRSLLVKTDVIEKQLEGFPDGERASPEEVRQVYLESFNRHSNEASSYDPNDDRYCSSLSTNPFAASGQVIEWIIADPAWSRASRTTDVELNEWSREMSKSEAGRLLGGPGSEKGCRDHLKDLLAGQPDVIHSRTKQKHRFSLAWVRSIEPSAVEKFRPE